ncbi:Alanyl-tRNA synthetase [Hordeum vulgare]|nr:Alanyl-tRNA synthetase [Hordeum vulgare]
MGENTFLAEFETQRDRDRIWEGSPWHVSRNAIVLAEFDDCMRPDEVKFDRPSLWARVPNLPYNLRNDAWGKLIAQQTDKGVTAVQFDHVGGFLRARVSIEEAHALLFVMETKIRARRVENLRYQLDLSEHGRNHGVRGTKQFRYENVWQTHMEYEQLVSTWQEQQRSDDLQGIMESVGALQRTLEPWGQKNSAVWQDFTHASVPHSASVTWRAIVAGREVLNLGLIHRIGDGSSIDVWTDKWIPSTETMTPTVKPPGTTVTLVSELIDIEAGAWRVDQVRENFAASDAEAILNIPLRRGGGADFLAWAHEKSGNYTVKSAYRALMTHNEHSAHVEGQVLGTSVEQNHLWKMLWSLKVVPKVRVFWWRVMCGILPDEATLKCRHIRDTSLCKLCQLADEDLEHALMHCSHARRFWVEAQALLDFHLPALHSDSWRKDILSDPSFSPKDRATIITIM